MAAAAPSAIVEAAKRWSGFGNERRVKDFFRVYALRWYARIQRPIVTILHCYQARSSFVPRSPHVSLHVALLLHQQIASPSLKARFVTRKSG
jgi:hypothetical protein